MSLKCTWEIWQLIKYSALSQCSQWSPWIYSFFFSTDSFSAGESNNMICFLVQSQTCRNFLVTWRHQKPENVAFSEGFEAADIHTASAHAFCSLHSQALPTCPPPMHSPCACYCTSILSFKRQCSRSCRLCSSSRTACLLHLMQAKIPGQYPLCHHGPNNEMASLQTLCPPLPPSPQTFPWVAMHGLWQWATRPWRRPSLEGKFVSWSCSSQEDAASHRTSSGQDGSCWHGCSTPWAGARWPWGWLMVHKEPGKHDPNNFSRLRGVLGASPSLPPS